MKKFYMLNEDPIQPFKSLNGTPVITEVTRVVLHPQDTRAFFTDSPQGWLCISEVNFFPR